MPGIRLLNGGCSSAGRAPALQAGGHRFESVHLHHGGNPVAASRQGLREQPREHRRLARRGASCAPGGIELRRGGC